MNVVLIAMLLAPLQSEPKSSLHPKTQQSTESGTAACAGIVKKALPTQFLKRSTPQVLPQASLDEISKIRERMGIKLFEGDKNSQEFANQLGKLNHQQVNPPETNRNPIHLGVRQAGFHEAVPTIEPAASFNAVVNNPFSSSRKSKTTESAAIQSLASAIESLDRHALKLELQGEFAKSKKLRKLSRKIRKQLQDLVGSRDN